MLRLLKFLWTGSFHEHSWKTIKEGKTWEHGRSKELPVGNWYDVRCEGCGKIRTFKT